MYLSSGTFDHSGSPCNRPMSNKGSAIRIPLAAAMDKIASNSTKKSTNQNTCNLNDYAKSITLNSQSRTIVMKVLLCQDLHKFGIFSQIPKKEFIC